MLKCLQALLCQGEGQGYPLCGGVSVGHQENVGCCFIQQVFETVARMVFLLHFFLLRPPSEQMLGVPWGPCDLESNCSHPGAPWQGPAASCSCESTSVGEDQGVGGTGLEARGVFWEGQSGSTVGCCALAVLHWTEQAELEMHWNTPKSTSKLCPPAATGVGRATEALGECSEPCQFPAAVTGTAGTESSSARAQCQSVLLLLVGLG